MTAHTTPSTSPSSSPSLNPNRQQDTEARQQQQQQQQQKQKQKGDTASAKANANAKTNTSGMTKEERRAMHEQQMAAKAAARASGAGGGSQPKQQQQQQQKKQQKQTKTIEQQKQHVQQQKQTGDGSHGYPLDGAYRLYSHLLMPHHLRTDGSMAAPVDDPSVIHPAMIRLGIKYASGSITGSTARAVALLNALKEVIQDYDGTPQDKRMSHDLDSRLKPMIDYIKRHPSRPMSISMGNMLKHVKMRIHKLNPELQQHEAKKKLLEEIDNYIEERIMFTRKQIVNLGAQRIMDGDVIMTFARSQVVQDILIEAQKNGRNFSVVVVANARPKHEEGASMLRTLALHGVRCSYTLITGASHVMKNVTKVLLGAHAMLSNGTLMSRVGTACIAMLAHRYNVPVLVCCETYKFSERSQLDSITKNEVADPTELTTRQSTNAVRTSQQEEQQVNNTSVDALNLLYDVTPMKFIDMVITELGQLPPTSVIHILREYGNPLLE